MDVVNSSSILGSMSYGFCVRYNKRTLAVFVPKWCIVLGKQYTVYCKRWTRISCTELTDIVCAAV